MYEEKMRRNRWKKNTVTVNKSNERDFSSKDVGRGGGGPGGDCLNLLLGYNTRPYCFYFYVTIDYFPQTIR